MAENEQNNDQAAAAQDQQQAPEGPGFALQRIYLKDSSFESPRSPASFQGKWSPRVTFDIKTRSQKIQDDLYEVVLVLTVEAKQDEENVAFLAEVQQGGLFGVKGFSNEQQEQVLAAVCPNILFPYAREAIDGLVVKGSFPPLMLAPVNFDALYAQRKQRDAEQAAEAGTSGNGNGASGAEETKA
ncbi:MAG: protein-export chaperone SecB [Pseudohongiellaceae bacterium]